MVSIIFWLLASLSCGFVWLHGGAEGRKAVGLFVVATLLTWMAQSVDTRWTGTHWSLLAVDTAYLAATYAFALRSDRFWPMWMSAFQLLTVATHLATIIGNNLIPKIYAAVATLWVVPLLLSMVVGVFLDYRQDRRLVTRDGPISMHDEFH